jgi:hypothetical protein
LKRGNTAPALQSPTISGPDERIDHLRDLARLPLREATTRHRRIADLPVRPALPAAQRGPNYTHLAR